MSQSAAQSPLKARCQRYDAGAAFTMWHFDLHGTESTAFHTFIKTTDTEGKHADGEEGRSGGGGDEGEEEMRQWRWRGTGGVRKKREAGGERLCKPLMTQAAAWCHTPEVQFMRRPTKSEEKATRFTAKSSKRSKQLVSTVFESCFNHKSENKNRKKWSIDSIFTIDSSSRS